ncbi:MAG: hypothetical protein KGJ13_07000 [Patescibacteria group bacterium]|nr:hypothetical protein [Patescibacteria group bacterium]
MGGLPSLSYGQSSAADAQATQQTPAFQQAGTYINFGQGTLAAPTEGTLTPTMSGGASGGSSMMPLYIVGGLAGVALLIGIFAIAKK